MLRHRSILRLSLLFFGVSVLLTGCCTTCTSISGRYSEMPVPMDVVASEAMMRVSSPARINGNLKQKMEERGKKSGCGEFFWSSWYNDGPAEMSYSRPEPCEENTIHVSRHSSKAAHRIINSRPAVRVASIDLDDEI